MPPAEAQGVSERLQERIRFEIAGSGGALPFSRYMELALYEPELGYYNAASHKFGAEGDFVTAPEISSLFSYCLARQCAEVLAELGGGSILEFGAGSGVMAADVLKELEVTGHLPDAYLIMELSAELRARQRATLAQRVPHLRDRVQWLDALPATLRGVVVANELVDAMPVHRFMRTQQGFAEAYVRLEGDGFAWSFVELSQGEVLRALETIQAILDDRAWRPGYLSEINLSGPAWVRTVDCLLEKGAALIIDYGFPRRELYHPDRSGGTLMCHYRHRAHDDPLVLVGLQDITAHVDFTALAEAAIEGELSVAGYTTQAHFLLSCGLLQYLERTAANDTRAQLSATQEVKKLTLPNEMGELFKVLALTKGLDKPLLGFTMMNHLARL